LILRFVFFALSMLCSSCGFDEPQFPACIEQHFVECAPFPMIGLDLAGHIKGFSLSLADWHSSARVGITSGTSSPPPIPNSLFLHHPLSHLTCMYLRTDFNKRAEIVLKLSKEQVIGKEFAEIIDIRDFDREKVFLRKSLCAFLI